MLALYMVLKIADTLGWVYGVVPRAGPVLRRTSSARDLTAPGCWWPKSDLCGIVPAIILIIPKAREHEGWLIGGCLLNCTGIVLNRFIFTVVTLAIPVMPFDVFVSYLPTWQEWGIALAVIGYGFLLFSLSYRYLPVFPKERELNLAQ